MESKEIKDLRRDRVTRKAVMLTVELTAITEEGPITWVERIREDYAPDPQRLRERLKSRLIKDNRLLTNMRIIEQTIGLYGMSEDEFFAKAELLATF